MPAEYLPGQRGVRLYGKPHLQEFLNHEVRHRSKILKGNFQEKLTPVQTSLQPHQGKINRLRR